MTEEAHSRQTLLEGSQEQQTCPTLRIYLLEISGFKVYASKAVVGPLDRLNCVIGPNGIGKSVLGEALAFALGANARMLRVKSISGVISSCPDEDGILPQAAQVTVHFVVVDAYTTALLGHISVRRTVTTSGRNTMQASVTMLPQPYYLPSSNASDNDDDDDDEEHQHEEEEVNAVEQEEEDKETELPWQTINGEQLRQLLSPYGLHVDALERVIVTQHRRAVDVADPKKLVKFIETLIGGGSVKQEIDELTVELAACEAEEDRLDDCLDALMAQSEALTPELQQWRRFLGSSMDYSLRLAAATKQRARLYEEHAQVAGAAAETEESKVIGSEAAQEAARVEADSLLLVKEATEEAAATAAVAVQQLVEQQKQLMEDVARAKVRARAARAAYTRAAAASGGAVDGTTQTTMDDEMEILKVKAVEAEHQWENVKHRLETLHEELVACAGVLERCNRNSGDALPESVREARQRWKTAQHRAAAAAPAATAAAARSQAAATAVTTAAAHVDTLEKEASEHHSACIAETAKETTLKTELEKVEREVDAATLTASTADARFQAHQQQGRKLHAALTSITNSLNALNPNNNEHQGSNQARHNSNSNSNSNTTVVDGAVATLSQQLKPSFHGRVHSVLRCIASECVDAVNAVLLEKCNPATTLVTATRSGAEATVTFFQTHRVPATVSCIILEELKRGSGTQQTQKKREKEGLQQLQAVEANSGGGKNKSATTTAVVPSCSLSALVQAREDVRDCDALVSNLFEGWFLVRDAAAAVHLLSEDRQKNMKEAVAAATAQQSTALNITRKNYVTLRGAVFKCDGEFYGERSEREVAQRQRYLLQTDYYSQQVQSSITSDDIHTSTADRVMQEHLRSQYAAVVADIDALECGNDEVVQAASAAHAALTLKHSAVSQTRTALLPVRRTLQKLRNAWQTTEKEVATAKRMHSEATEKLVSLQAAALKAQQIHAQCVADENAAHQGYAAAAEECEIATHALHAETAAAVLRSTIVDCEREAAACKTQLAEIRMHMLQLSTAQEAARVAGEGAAAAAAQVDAATAAVADVKKKIRSAEKTVKATEKEQKKADSEWRSAVERHQTAATAHQRLLARIHSARTLEEDSLAQALRMGRESMEAMQQAENLAQNLVAVKKVLMPLADPNHDNNNDAAESDDDDDDALDEEDQPTTSSSKRPRCSTRGKSTSHRHQHHRSQNKNNNSSSINEDEDEFWEESVVDAVLAELAQQRRSLETQHASLDESAIGTATHLISEITAAQCQLQHQEAHTQTLGARITQLRAARYHRFSTAMDTAATSLSSIFQRLTGGVGDAHCRYSKDVDAAFEDGVKFSVRPDNGAWRSFSALSGGQQSLAALALCFALQAAAPSPFYFFDEIDAALDTINAQRLAEFLVDVCSGNVINAPPPGCRAPPPPPQIIAVSHRAPVMHAADCTLAVYLVLDEQAKWLQTCVMTLYTPDEDEDECEEEEDKKDEQEEESNPKSVVVKKKKQKKKKLMMMLGGLPKALSSAPLQEIERALTAGIVRTRAACITTTTTTTATSNEA